MKTIIKVYIDGYSDPKLSEYFVVEEPTKKEIQLKIADFKFKFIGKYRDNAKNRLLKQVGKQYDLYSFPEEPSSLWLKAKRVRRKVYKKDKYIYKVRLTRENGKINYIKWSSNKLKMMRRLQKYRI